MVYKAKILIIDTKGSKRKMVESKPRRLVNLKFGLRLATCPLCGHIPRVYKSGDMDMGFGRLHFECKNPICCLEYLVGRYDDYRTLRQNLKNEPELIEGILFWNNDVDGNIEDYIL